MVTPLLIPSCKPTFVATQPNQIVVVKPASPGVHHIWVDADWVWSRNSRNYQWRNGYWAVPSNNRGYTKGYWRTSPRGNYWVIGRWN